jgi:hypothetical protein
MHHGSGVLWANACARAGQAALAAGMGRATVACRSLLACQRRGPPGTVGRMPTQQSLFSEIIIYLNIS